ncbi:MAG TPA: hypothetical protein VGC21_11285 [Telluria sp.]|jgi:hypothetical protein
MDMTEYEQVGKLIFGVQRLDGALQGLDRQFSGEGMALDGMTEEPAVKLARRMAVSEAYFLKHNTPGGTVDEFNRTAALVCELEMRSNAVSGGRTEGLDDLLAIMRDAHFKIADVMDALELKEYPTDTLRARASAAS